MEEKKFLDAQFAAMRCLFANANRDTKEYPQPFVDAQFRLLPDNDIGQAKSSEKTPEQMLDLVLNVIQPQLGGTVTFGELEE